MSGAKHGSAEKGSSAKPAEAYQPSMKGGSTGDVDLDTDNKLGKLRLSSYYTSLTRFCFTITFSIALPLTIWIADK